MTGPTISVVTIVRNDLVGLQRTVRSVRAQTYPHIEHIVVDGASTDGAPALLAQLDPAPVWISEPDDGRYDAMNRGTALAGGDLVWYMNAGDTFHSDASAELVAREHERTGFRWAFGLSNVVDDRGTIGTRGSLPFDLTDLLLGRAIVPHQATVFARDLVDEVGGYDTRIGLIADQLLIARAALVAPPHGILAFLCDFDAHGAGSTRGAAAHARDLAAVRRALGVRLTRHAALDALVAGLSLAGVLAGRAQRKVVGRLVRPRTVAGDVVR